MSAASATRNGRKTPNWIVGLIALLAVVLGFYLAFVKTLPFVPDNRFELQAVFQDAQNVRVKSPVRAAGVEVGKVTEVGHLYDENGDGLDGAVVTMRLTDDALPVREDTTLALRPRLFLEGNLFIDLSPGSPGSPELESGAMLPASQTSISVQFDQVLTGLQKPVRTQLQTFLAEFGAALDDFGGADGFRELYRTSPDAYRYTAEVNEAFLGTEPGDLRGFIRNLGDTIAALDRNEVQLQDLVTNLRIVTGSFAAEADALEQGIAELPRLLAVGRPTLADLNDSFPALRAFAREALPGVRSSNSALVQATPWIRQLRLLFSKPELRGLVKDLRPTIPALARLAKTSIPFLDESRLLSSCFNRVIIPWSNTDVPVSPLDTDGAGPVYKETGYGLAGLAGESRSGDANGQQFRVLGSGGGSTVQIPGDQNETGEMLAGFSLSPLLGAEPAKNSSQKTPFRPDVPCETQDPPNLNSLLGAPPTQTATKESDGPFLGSARAQSIIDEFIRLQGRQDIVKSLGATGRSREAKELAKQVLNDLVAFNQKSIPEFQKIVRQRTTAGN